MKTTVTAIIELETDAPDTDAATLAEDFEAYMIECIGSPHGNIFNPDTGEDKGEIEVNSFDLAKGIHFTKDELHIIGQMLQITWDCQRMLGLDEYLMIEDPNLPERKMANILTNITTKVNTARDEA